jgi:hypothetical protein
VEAKRCKKCDDYKPLSRFSKASKEKDGLQAWCKQCAADYFQENKDKILPRIKDRQRRQVTESRWYIWNYLLDHPCIDCGEPDPVVLDFDHVRGVKCFNISTSVGKVSLSLLQEEIAKCDVRCANCHRRKTAKERNYYKWLGDSNVEEDAFFRRLDSLGDRLGKAPARYAGTP